MFKKNADLCSSTSITKQKPKPKAPQNECQQCALILLLCDDACTENYVLYTPNNSFVSLELTKGSVVVGGEQAPLHVVS